MRLMAVSARHARRRIRIDTTLHVVTDKTAGKYFETPMLIEDKAKFLTMTQIKDLDGGHVMNDQERMSKVLAQQ